MGRGSVRPEPAGHRREVHAAAGSEELAAPCQPGERLIDSRARAEMEQHLGADWGSLRECARPLKNGFCEAFHNVTNCRNYTPFSDTIRVEPFPRSER
jgi:hypothetical protein